MNVTIFSEKVFSVLRSLVSLINTLVGQNQIQIFVGISAGIIALFIPFLILAFEQNKNKRTSYVEFETDLSFLFLKVFLSNISLNFLVRIVTLLFLPIFFFGFDIFSVKLLSLALFGFGVYSSYVTLKFIYSWLTENRSEDCRYYLEHEKTLEDLLKKLNKKNQTIDENDVEDVNDFKIFFVDLLKIRVPYPASKRDSFRLRSYISIWNSEKMGKLYELHYLAWKTLFENQVAIDQADSDESSFFSAVSSLLQSSLSELIKSGQHHYLFGIKAFYESKKNFAVVVKQDTVFYKSNFLELLSEALTDLEKEEHKKRIALNPQFFAELTLFLEKEMM